MSDKEKLDVEALHTKIVEAMHTCYDPEIPVDIYELGLIYDIDISDDGIVDVKMTLTSPNCPAVGTLPPEVEWKVSEVEGVKTAYVHLVWEPEWTQERMSEAAKLELNIM